MNTEQPGPGQTDAQNVWQVLVSNINDPKNLGIADINYWVVEGNVGAVEKFTRNGGASIRARRIGSAPGHANAALIPDAGAANASSQYDAAHGADKARDGILASDDVQNFWASANGQDVGAWWQTDLGQIINIAEIQVHFRAHSGENQKPSHNTIHKNTSEHPNKNTSEHPNNKPPRNTQNRIQTGPRFPVSLLLPQLSPTR